MHVSVTPEFLSVSTIDIPKCDRHVHTYAHPENRSLIESFMLMRSAITPTRFCLCLYVGERESSYIAQEFVQLVHLRGLEPFASCVFDVTG